ncbi:MAG: LCP family protein [Anaerolineaceae bacterium]|nr:MAG: LCP family protein [Anaerolineaceae bacterium]
MYKSRQPVLPSWLSFLLSVAFVISGITVIIFAYLTTQVLWTRSVNPVEAAAADVAEVELQMEQDGPALAPVLVPGEPSPTVIPTSAALAGDQRTNILVMGIDRRPGESFISRTDSMMLISVDAQDEKISILSIPRDLYVMIPGFGRDRVNTAFVYGSTGNNPAGGAALAMRTLEYNLGIHIDHYVLLDFSAVTKGIDTLGGVQVYVPVEINDPTFPDMNYGYDPLYIPAGSQQMDGRTALKYARTRHIDNDFGRAMRQQQVLLAARDKALGLGMPGLLARAPELFKRVEQGVRTDLSLEQIVELSRTASGIATENIRNEVLDGNYVSPYITDKGAQVLVLDLEKGTPFIRSLFYDE